MHGYVFRIMYSRHQADRRNKKKMFTAGWEVWYLEPYEYIVI